MSNNLNIFYSNSLDIHYHKLKTSLFGGQSPPFKRRLMVVYGPAMQSWLMLKMAQDPEVGIATGIEFLYLNHAFEQLLALTGNGSIKLPSTLELSLALEAKLYKIIAEYIQFEPQEQREWNFLLHYLQVDPLKLKITPKMEKRVTGLSQHLATLFRDYGRYGGALLEEWKEPGKGGWQASLWRTLFDEKTGWGSPLEMMKGPLQAIDNAEIHFFSISFISKSEFEFIHRLSEKNQVHYYLLSPCAAFWSDIRSDKENNFMYRQWQNKGETLTAAALELEEFLRDRNPLLANFGRLGREVATQMEGSEALITAHYLLPASVEAIHEDLFHHEDLHLQEDEKPLTLLKAVQSDILLMRNPEGEPLYDIDEEDESIQLHRAPTRRREIQILYHQLLRIMHKNPSIHPADVIVMAPQIADYVPHIKAFFGSEQSLLDYQLLDLGMQNHHEIVQGLLQLIEVGGSRWEVNDLLQLFENRAFQRRHQISMNDYRAIQSWIEKTGIYWGNDPHHRDDLLRRRHCRQGVVESTAIGTWDYGFTRLMMGLTTLLDDTSLLKDSEILPSDQIEFSQTDLLSKWIRLIHSLQDDLSPLHDGTKMTIREWTIFLECLLEAYFKQDHDSAESIHEMEELKHQLDLLRSSGTAANDTLFPFNSIKIHLTALLEQQEMTYRENHLQAVRFCSMMPLRSIPAKVIAMIGMEEGAFPRQNQFTSLNLMSGIKECDYCPLPTDYDRYLFLEALHSAQEYILFSYQGYSPKDQKELQPSLVITELFNYLDKFYAVLQTKPSEHCLYKHPFDSFDEKYFQSGSRLANYSMQDYKAALARYQLQKEPIHLFATHFPATVSSQQTCEEIHVIELKHLYQLAKNPIKFYLNRGMEIYLETPEKRKIKQEEELTVSSLTSYQIREKCLQEPIQHLLQQAERMGQLPLGLFKTVATNKMEEENETIVAAMAHFGIKQNDIFQIEFNQNYKVSTEIKEGLWMLPPVSIQINGSSHLIVGQLPHVSPQGLLVSGKSSLEDIWKVWPHFLLYQYAVGIFPKSLQPQIVALQARKPKKAFFQDPTPYLHAWVRYYQLCHQQISPLLPDWISAIATQNEEGLLKKMEKSAGPEVEWIFQQGRLPGVAQMMKEWKPCVDELAFDLLQAWYPSKVQEGDDA